MTTKKSKPTKLKKISISLTEREAGLLQYYAKLNGVTKGKALKKLMKAGLRDISEEAAKKTPRNQLGLFDAVQADLFSLDEIRQK